MNNSLGLLFLLLAIPLVGTARAANVAGLAWNESKIHGLRALDKSAVANLIDDIRDTSGPVPRPSAEQIGEFRWVDLAGNGNYQLVLTEDVNGRHFYNALIVYGRDSSGTLRAQEIRGWEIGRLTDVIRDLNGDGNDELIIPTQQSCSTYRGAGAVPVWPAVYRLANGHYVEAGKDFPRFYKNEILPKLNEAIASAKADRASAWLLMERDKILRMLGQNPTAGLRPAYQWMKSGDPELREDAAVVFCEVGGHTEELTVLSSDHNISVADAAKFAMEHAPGSFNRSNQMPSERIVN